MTIAHCNEKKQMEGQIGHLETTLSEEGNLWEKKGIEK